ncbi:Wzz/FepE/Etk N-terminal domain-containing protein [Peptostreptococcaceae bacterium AGR-M142]
MNQNINQNYDYEEISLREIIETVIKGFKTIAVCGLIGLIISASVSYFVLEPTYEAETQLIASTTVDKMTNTLGDGSDVDEILDTMSKYPSMTMETYKEQIKNPQILGLTIEQLNLSEKGITIENLSNMISINNAKNTNLINLKVKYKDPVLATKIANTLANNFTKYISEMVKEKMVTSSKFIKDQIDKEKEQLDEALVELKEFLKEPKSMDELKGEVSSKLSILNTYKNNVTNKELELTTKRAGLKEAKAKLTQINPTIKTTKSLANDAILSQLATQSNMGLNETSNILINDEEVNPVYIQLESKIANYEIDIASLQTEISTTKTQIKKIEKELEELRVLLADKSYKDTLINNKVDLAQGTYDSFLNKYETTTIAESAEAGKSAIMIAYQATVPSKPVGPRKALNMAIGLILGTMLGVFAVFIRAYWENTSDESTLTKNRLKKDDK